ncbi:hypothetical protein WALSEDRAFT_60373 [Wallemia mellicola CBS 633.66]|uniref:Nucleoporin protein Ndc1-Nup n=1 Tax=Wallemia mellicola (strain ATCC MYA-4683 / CBS 633.66) TaxID=671144 RepID=I4YCJ0_WALMC|nr:hypothetical protein WALSEDRAFT_60373 [Wallemia mellicola CBS 633.66]EIM21682.1 hypothetical protein WALSEDRAFT_60373 [Wallemia mellicola CBS 633.66]|eukprot:XP_006958369.1 hypothetical protein WALSEDRAFT_60373 [Wallemia mellicola CBS 633.66]
MQARPASKLTIRKPDSGVSNTTYATLCKLVLRKRMSRVLVLSLVSKIAIFALSTSNVRDGFSIILSPFGLQRILFALLAFILADIPVIITRKLALLSSFFYVNNAYSLTKQSAKSQPAPVGPSKHLKALLLDQKTYNLAVTYAFSAIAYGAVYISCLSAYEDEAGFTPFTSHIRRGWQFNERFIFLFLNAALLGAVYALRQLWNDRFVTRFPSNLSSSISSRAQSHLKRNVPMAMKFALIVVLTVLSSYLLTKKSIYRTVASLSLATFRPHLFTLLRQNNVTFGLVLRTTVFALGLVSSWEVTNTLFDIYSVHPIIISKIAPNPTDCLISGMQSTDFYYKYFAYLEFVKVFSSSQERRQEVYKDIHRKPSSWDKILSVAVQELVEGRTKVLTKGVPTNKTPTVVNSTPDATTSSSKLRVVDNQEIFKRNPKSTVDNFIADVQVDKKASMFSKQTENVPADQGIGFDKILSPEIVKTLKNSIYGNEESNVNAKIRLLAPDIKLVSLCSLGLAYLGAASIQEDEFGLIQHNIPQVIHEVTSTLLTYEELQIDLEKLTKNSNHLKEYSTRVQEIQNALSILLFAFKDYVKSFNLDEKTQKRVELAIKEMK